MLSSPGSKSTTSIGINLGKCESLFVINQNDVSLGLDEERKYIVEEGDFKVMGWKESGMVYAMVI